MKMKRRYAAGLILLTLTVVALPGLARRILPAVAGEVTLSRDGFAMNTVIRISVTGSGEQQTQAVLDESFALLNHLDAELSLYREESTLSKINARAGGEALPVSSDVFAAVTKAQEMCRLTEGVFNPLIGPITKLWKINQTPDSPGTFSLPAQASIDAALTLTDPVGLGCRPEGDGGSVHLAQRGAALDLGGIAKGYASTEITTLLRARGISSALVNLGGNVHVLGMNGGRRWNIGIRNPLSNTNNPLALVLAVSDACQKGMAVVTSGGYERYRVVDGVRYSHFFDPRTGMPVRNDLLSATLISPDGSLADALATAFMIMGSERAMEFLRDHPGLSALLIRHDASGGLEILATENLREMVQRPLAEVRYF